MNENGILFRIKNWFKKSYVPSRSINFENKFERVFERKPYDVFTTEFDRITNASELDEIIGPLSDKCDLDEVWREFRFGLTSWKTNVQTHAVNASEKICSKCGEDARQDTAVTLLIDQSGSMDGQKMLLAAATADVVSEFLLHLGITVEILGFTTTSWKGGKSRKKWKWDSCPPQPGRLCDLLHIVYLSATNRYPAGKANALRNMLRPDLLKENVDGEALEWAASRLIDLEQRNKILLVISDGAPVDDSTLLENHPDILLDHLKQVVKKLETMTTIKIGAVGMGYNVGTYYSNFRNVKTPCDLGLAVIDQLEKQIMENLV